MISPLPGQVKNSESSQECPQLFRRAASLVISAAESSLNVQSRAHSTATLAPYEMHCCSARVVAQLEQMLLSTGQRKGRAGGHTSAPDSHKQRCPALSLAPGSTPFSWQRQTASSSRAEHTTQEKPDLKWRRLGAGKEAEKPGRATQLCLAAAGQALRLAAGKAKRHSPARITKLPCLHPRRGSP